MAKKKKKNSKNVKNNSRIDVMSFLLIILGVIFGIIVYTEQGGLGSVIKDFLLGGFLGKFAFVFPIVLILMGIYIIFKDYSRFKVKPWIVCILVLSITGLFTAIDCEDIIRSDNMNFIEKMMEIASEGSKFTGGGFFGAITAVPISGGFSETIALVIYFALLFISTLTIFGIAFSTIIVGIFSFIKKLGEKSKEGAQTIASRFSRDDEEDEEEYEEEVAAIPVKTKISKPAPAPIKNKKFAEIMEQTKVVDSGKQISFNDLDLDDLDVEDNSGEDDEEPEEEIEEVPEEVIEEPKPKLVKLPNIALNFGELISPPIVKVE